MPREERGRRPDYEIKVLDKDSQERMKVGAAWLKEDGSIYIKLERFVVLQGGGQFAITAFPVDEEGPYERPEGGLRRSDPEDREDTERRSPRVTRTARTRRTSRR